LFVEGQETIKAVKTLRKPNIPKIQKIQLMRQYFKDVKSKMQEENQMKLSIKLDADEDLSKGVFVKKKKIEGLEKNRPEVFLFNFKDPTESSDGVGQASATLSSLEIS
jgi:Domain of unknown function (DUF4615)